MNVFPSFLSSPCIFFSASSSSWSPLLSGQTRTLRCSCRRGYQVFLPPPVTIPLIASHRAPSPVPNDVSPPPSSGLWAGADDIAPLRLRNKSPPSLTHLSRCTSETYATFFCPFSFFAPLRGGIPFPCFRSRSLFIPRTLGPTFLPL